MRRSLILPAALLWLVPSADVVLAADPPAEHGQTEAAEQPHGEEAAHGDTTGTHGDDYDVLVVPALYVASDALLGRLVSFVENGGHLVLTLKSGFADESSRIRWVRAPGPLREAAGFSYQEFSFDFKTYHKKEDSHQTIVDPQQQWLIDLETSN